MEYVASLQSFLRGFAAPFAGPSFTAATPSGVSSSADSEPHKICVVTQNVWCHYAATPGDELKCRFGKKERYGVNKDVMSGFDVTSRLQAIANAVQEQGADILLVQELFLFRVSPLVTLSHNFITFQQMMRNIGLIYHTTPTLSCTFVGQNSGLAVFSRFPIVRESAETFVASHEKLNNKGVIGALVQIAPGKQLAVVCTHLDSHASNPVRFSQMQQVSNMVDELRRTAGSATAVVVGGDFNVCPQTVEQGGYDDGTQFRQLQTIMGSAALQPLFDDVRAMPLTIENTTLDHIFYSGMRVPASAEGTADDDTKRKAPREILRAADVLTGHAASDHFGLVARFEV